MSTIRFIYCIYSKHSYTVTQSDSNETDAATIVLKLVKLEIQNWLSLIHFAESKANIVTTKAERVRKSNSYLSFLHYLVHNQDHIRSGLMVNCRRDKIMCQRKYACWKLIPPEPPKDDQSST